MARLTPENALLPEDTIEYEASICRESFFDFVLEFWDCVPGAGKLVYNWHIGFMAEEMQKLARRVVAGLPREYDLVVNIPPGTSKSTVISILFPAWVWTIFPQARFISATHTDNLALDLAAKSRTVITSEKYQRLFPFVTLAKDSVEYFTNTSGGDRLTCTVGGKTPMGFHASVILVDDPIDPQGARSEVEISTAEHFITEVIPSRKVDKEVSPIVLVMQRLEYRDPTAVMLRMAESPDVPPVRHICLPGEQSEDISPPLSEIRKKYPEAYLEDRLLDPKRLSRRVLNEFKVRLRTGFWSQIMQKPTPPGGGMFKVQYFQLRVRSAPYQARRVRAWDRAACLVAGTQVETSGGSKPIESVRSGDLVLTRKGYRRVQWAGVSGFVDTVVSVLFSNGSTVTGTEDHPVWDERSQSWICLDTLDGDCYNLSIVSESKRAAWKRSSFRELSTIARKVVDTSIRGLGRAGERSPCIELCGSTIEVIFPLAIKFTTRTGTGITTSSRILNASVPESIIESTGFLENGTKPLHENDIKGSWLKHRGEHWRKPSPNGLSAFNVERGSGPSIGISRGSSFVAPSVPVDTIWEPSLESVLSAPGSFGASRELTLAVMFARKGTGPGIVLPAERSFVESHKPRNSVPKAVVLPGNMPEGGRIPVYDLQVEGEHEFFANGVLVHNTQDGGCYTAGVLMAKDIQGQYYVENVVHGQWDPYERNDIIAAVALRDRVRYGPKFEPMIIIEEETGSTGKESFRRMAAQLEGFRVKSDKPTGSKDVRAEPWSSACAAGLVRIVDNGEKENWGKSDWDINGYILEHTLFKPMPGKRIGGIVDRVDASSAAYNYLAGTKVGEVMKVFTLGETRNKGLRLVVCTRDNLVNTTTEHRTLLISIQDPIIEEQHAAFNGDQAASGNSSSSGVSPEPSRGQNGVIQAERVADETGVAGQVGGGVLAVARVPGEPAHSLVRCLGILILRFADLAANELQDEWDKPVSPWNKTPSELVLSRDDAKRLWAFLLKKRDPGAEIVVIQDDGDRRALSLAYAICDVLRQPRSVVHVVGHEEMNHIGKAAPNEHCYEVAKVGRSAVVG